MSFKTQPVFIHESNGWDDTIMTHPVFKFMRVWEQALKDKTMFDAPFGTWHTPDFVYTDEQGKSSSGADGFKNQFEMHNALLVDFAHEPHMVWVSETADGYNAWGQAYMYCNLKVPGEKKETDATGKLWEYKFAGAWYMTFRRESGTPGGMKMSGMTVYTNSLPLMATAVAKGMLPQELMFKQAR